MTNHPFNVKALYDYVSPEEDDLNFKSNQIITVTEEEDADWYYGEFEGDDGTKQEGLFPKNFVKAFEPERPPRPNRSGRAKKDPEPPALNDDEGSAPIEKHAPVPALRSPQPESQHGQNIVEEAEVFQLEQSKESAPNAVSNVAPPKPQPASVSKPPPPPAAEKPTSNAFRDRINAFNKPAAPPVAPVKPGGLGSGAGSGFVKKPFVAPPPSKNAYVPPPRQPPPQKIYRREEDGEVVSKASEVSQEDTNQLQITSAPDEEEEEQPKPTSLKDRIALLQKQQMEQAARHAEATQRKEKHKKPAKSAEAEEASADLDDQEGEALEKVESTGTPEKRSLDAARRRRKSKDEAVVTSPAGVHSTDVLTDGNEADQSGAGDTEDGEEISTGRDDSDGRAGMSDAHPASQAARGEAPETADKPFGDLLANDDDDEEEDEDDVDEDDVDPEVKRRMEIRERMAKMSGGMGMAAMFGPPGGLPSKTPTKKGSASSDRKASGQAAQRPDSPLPRAAPVPVMPGIQKVRSPEQPVSEEVGKEEEDLPKSVIQGREPEQMPDVEDIQEAPVAPSRKSTDRPVPPSLAHDRPVPPPPNQSRVPPQPTSGRPVPAPPQASRPVPPPPPHQLMSPSEGSVSDDELSSHDRRGTDGEGSQPTKEVPPPPSASLLPHRPHSPPLRPSEHTLQDVQTSPSTSDELPKRTIRAPGSSVPVLPPPSAPQSRAPPPPPPFAAPLRKSATADRLPPQAQSHQRHHESDEEITEYDGDYDTDIASGKAHKDALKAHARTPSLEDESVTEEASLHHSGLPSIGPPPGAAPRAVPPPPPPNAQSKRQSSDMPRGAPPPPPPPPKQHDENDYDPYRYTAPVHGLSSPQQEETQPTWTPTVEAPEPSYSSPASQHRRGPSSSQSHPHHPQSPNMSAPLTPAPRQSADMQRTSTTIRRSTDLARPSGEHFMAGDVDLAEASKWWTQPNAPPPVFRSRQDVIFEVDENSTTKRGGKKSVAKDVYVLYMDYSQTVISAHYEVADPATPSVLEQRHESPPRSPRQDELENVHSSIGLRIANTAKSKENAIIGDGMPHSLPFEIISSIPDALRPVGVRAYGALVYANLANASVQQHDEIRPGDIVTFRNAKFGGHKGPMKAKYSLEVGKPDHVGIVVDWDGSKKKIRAWEQGRESKKVKIESFKLGDMKSGEVKVWRVMGRSWVNWEGTN